MLTTVISLLVALAATPPDAPSDDRRVPFPELPRPAAGTIADAVPVAFGELDLEMRAMVERLSPALASPEPRPVPDDAYALWRLPRSGTVLLIADEDRVRAGCMLFVLARTANDTVMATGFPFGMLAGAHWVSVQEGDCDGDGHPDALVRSSAMGCGLNAGIGGDWIVLLRPASPGRTPQASLLELPVSHGAYPLDVDGNGRLEFVVQMFGGCERCTDGKPHNFWVWEMVGIQDGRLVDLNATVMDFPRFEWLSFDRKDRWRPLLTPEMKRQVRGEGPGLPPYRRGRG